MKHEAKDEKEKIWILSIIHKVSDTNACGKKEEEKGKKKYYCE